MVLQFWAQTRQQLNKQESDIFSNFEKKGFCSFQFNENIINIILPTKVCINFQTQVYNTFSRLVLYPPLGLTHSPTVAQSIIPPRRCRSSMTYEMVRIVGLLHLQEIFCKQAYYPFFIQEEVYKQQHSQQNKMHLLIQLQNSNWFTKNNKEILTLTSLK